jgi:biopolymer transport protein ExbB
MTNLRKMFFAVCTVLLLTGLAYAAAPKAAPVTQQGMTLWQTLVAGGLIMIVIGLVSLVGLTIIVYDIITFKAEKLLPRKLYDIIISKIENYDLKGIREACMMENNPLSRIVLTGLDRSKASLKDPAVKEAMEHRARIEIGNLWQNLNYLSDIVTVSPLLGLLGTVFGMIQAFNAIPIQSTGVKVPLLVAGISKAMVATGAGLIVAISVLMAYSFFRGRVQELTNLIETYTTDIIKTMENV